MTHKLNIPMTMAIRELQKFNVEFTPFLFPYKEKGGTEHSSSQLGVPEHQIIKTLIMEDQDKHPVVILMHGDLKVSTKKLARDLNLKSISPCKPEIADKHSGYLVGGTSPFGTKHKMPVYVESSILELECLYINGGQRGFLVKITPQDLVRVLTPTPVSVGIPNTF